jgi:hypothetical protein
LVSAWVTMVVTPNTMTPRSAAEAGIRLPPAGKWTIQVTVANNSAEPVWDCRVAVLSDWGSSPTHATDDALGVLAPGEDRNIEPVGEMLIPTSVTNPMPSQFPPVRLGFVDSAGRRWIRHGDGRLESSGTVNRGSHADRLRGRP